MEIINTVSNVRLFRKLHTKACSHKKQAIAVAYKKLCQLSAEIKIPFNFERDFLLV